MLRDIGRIRRYIAIDSPIAAGRMINALFAACDGLAQFPNRGRRGPKGTRELTTVWPYIIVYRVREDGTVDVEHIRHGAQLP
jgi:toxin ParE1/3/4